MIIVVEFLISDSQSAETTASELLDIGLERMLLFGDLVAGAEFDDLASHTVGKRLSLSDDS